MSEWRIPAKARASRQYDMVRHGQTGQVRALGFAASVYDRTDLLSS